MEKSMLGSQCLRCGHIHYPPRTLCRQCGHDEFKHTPLPKSGTLLTFTKRWFPPFGEHADFVTLGIVELENGTRITGQLKIAEPEIGMRVQGQVEKVGMVFFPA